MRSYSFLFFIFLFHNLNGQALSDELRFGQHLVVKKNYEEAIFVLNTLQQNPKLSLIQRDSIHIFLGNIYYNQKDLLRSNNHFDSPVSTGSVSTRMAAGSAVSS